jgi:aminoacrylate hydrolase
MKDQTGTVGQIHYRLAGAGLNLLLVSGLNGQGRFWDAVHAPLSERYTVLTYDQRGCGITPDDGAVWNIEALASDAFMLASAVFGTDPFVVLGHSTGGAIAQQMAATQPERITAVVLSGTWMQADDYMRALFGLRQCLLARAPDLDPVLSNILRVAPADFRPPQPGVALNASVTLRRIDALISHQGASLAPQITAPALVICAQDDCIVPPNLSVALHEALAHSTLHMMQHGGHFFVQTRAELFAHSALDWLD